MASPYAGRAAAIAAAKSSSSSSSSSKSSAPAAVSAPAPSLVPKLTIAPLVGTGGITPVSAANQQSIPKTQDVGVNVQTGQMFQGATTGPYTYQAAKSTGYVAPKGVTIVNTTAPKVVTPTASKTSTGNSFTPQSGSLAFFISQNGGDRTKGLEAYQKAQEGKKVVIAPISERKQNEKSPIPTEETEEERNKRLGIVKKTPAKVDVPKVTDPKTVKFWTDQGKTLKEAVDLAKTERAKTTLTDIRETEGKTIQDQLLNTQKLITEQELQDKTIEEQMLIKDNQEKFNKQDTELGTEISDWNKYFSKYEDVQTKEGESFENDRLNQVRSGILQKLAARGINIANIPPEQLLALSGEAGATAFKDINDKKTNIMNNISKKEEEKMLALNDLRSRKVLNESQYNSALTTIKATANAQRTQLQNTFNTNAYNILFGKLQNDQSTGNTLASNINSLLTQYGVNATLAPKFASVLSATSLADAQAKIVDILSKDSNLATELDNARKASTAATILGQQNLALNTQKEIADQNEVKRKAEIATLDKMLSEGQILPADYQKQATAINAKYYGTSSGGASTSAAPSTSNPLTSDPFAGFKK